MTAQSEPVEIYCVKCKARTGSKDRGHHHEERPRCHPLRMRGVRHQEVPNRRPPLSNTKNADILHRFIPAAGCLCTADWTTCRAGLCTKAR